MPLVVIKGGSTAFALCDSLNMQNFKSLDCLYLCQSLKRVIQIGFNKIGASSLGRFFAKNNYRVIEPKRALRVWSNLQASRPAFEGLSFDLAWDLEDHVSGVHISNCFKRIY